MSDLVERARRKKYRREIWVEPHGTMDAPCDADDDGAEAYFVNPDGPELADRIEALESENARLQDDAQIGRKLRLGELPFQRPTGPSLNRSHGDDNG